MDTEGVLDLIREFRSISKELREIKLNSAPFRTLNSRRNKIYEALADIAFPGSATRTTKSWNNVIDWMEKFQNECVNR